MGRSMEKKQEIGKETKALSRKGERGKRKVDKSY